MGLQKHGVVEHGVAEHGVAGCGVAGAWCCRVWGCRSMRFQEQGVTGAGGYRSMGLQEHELARAWGCTAWDRSSMALHPLLIGQREGGVDRRWD